MKIIIDTNVLASGTFFGGIPGDVINAWIEDEFSINVDEAIFAEYQRVLTSLSKKYRFNDVEALLQLYSLKANWVGRSKLKNQVCKDLDDDKFIACALASQSKVIVSGDKLLLECDGYNDLSIITPKEFFNQYLL